MVTLGRDVRIAAAAAALAAVSLVALAGAPDASAKARCASKAPGGEWPTYGHDYSNTRTQPAEKVISPANADDLEPAWVLAVEREGGTGDIAGTPVVSGGCVYVASARGWIAAVNAKNGKLVWDYQIPDRVYVYSSVGLSRTRVYVSVNRSSQGLTGCPADDPCRGPFVVALRRDTGRLDWASRPIDRQKGSETYASPIGVSGNVLVGVSGGIAELTADPSVRDNFQGSMVFLDAQSGRIVKKTWTIHRPGRPDDDFAGAGIWGTPAIDRRRGVGYVGTANPYVPRAAHPHAGAVLKLDVDPRSRRFGEIVDFGQGTPEEYLELLEQTPCIDFPGNVPPYPTGLGSCSDLDLDVGASPNLFRDERGRLVVGAGQKSGVYHLFDARTMEPIWRSVVGPPGYFGGIVGSTAYDGESIYGPITIPGYLWAVDAASGGLRWFAPILDVLHWGPPVAVANGVVYSVDYAGNLDAVDASSGVTLARHPLALGAGGDGVASWAGVSVARNTVYAGVGVGGADDGAVIAFRLPGG